MKKVIQNDSKKKKAKVGKIILYIFLVVLIVILIALVTIGIIWRNEIRSIASINKVDDYGMYQMKYYGDYGFDDFLKQGAKSDSDIEKFVTKRLLKGLPINLNMDSAGCTAFVTRNEKGEIVYGRNFDFPYAPSVQVYTKPENGYASISTVNLSFAGYKKDKLPTNITNEFMMLAAPYLPFDGMNEKGVAMALLAVPEASCATDDNKVTLNTTTAIRLVLDKASNVDEAVQLLKQYNIYFSGDVACHYLIADSTGKSVLVEYYDDELKVTYPNNQDYQIASNFIAYNDVNIGEGYTEFDRYNEVEKTIKESNKDLTEEESINLLKKIGMINRKGEDILQWTALYNLSNGDIDLFAHRNIDNIIKTSLNIDK